MTRLIIVKNDGGGMFVDERIYTEEEFEIFVERKGLDLSFDYLTFLELNGDYTGEITRKLNAQDNNSRYLALVV